jgi:UDP-N-acetylmuramyl pentapeptide phosphotransferase/UDP-N-acetylglucosamine-1-phosphate transferase
MLGASLRKSSICCGFRFAAFAVVGVANALNICDGFNRLTSVLRHFYIGKTYFFQNNIL